MHQWHRLCWGVSPLARVPGRLSSQFILTGVPPIASFRWLQNYSAVGWCLDNKFIAHSHVENFFTFFSRLHEVSFWRKAGAFVPTNLSSTAMEYSDELPDMITIFRKTLQMYTEVREAIKANLPESSRTLRDTTVGHLSISVTNCF